MTGNRSTTGELQGIARFTFHEGGLDEFERLSAECMEIVCEKDTGTLQYEHVASDRGSYRLTWCQQSTSGCPQRSGGRQPECASQGVTRSWSSGWVRRRLAWFGAPHGS